MPTTSTRHWFQFRLRTLLVGVVALAIPCAYLGQVAKFVAARTAWMEAHDSWSDVDEFYRADIVFPQPPPPPLIRRWLGDKSYRFVEVYDYRELSEAKALFPESLIDDQRPNAQHRQILPEWWKTRPR